jgi:hypothetical protein
MQRIPALLAVLRFADLRGLTVYLWSGFALAVVSLALHDSPLARYDTSGLDGDLLTYGGVWLLLLAVMPALGWFEDVASARSRLRPRAHTRSVPGPDDPAGRTAVLGRAGSVGAPGVSAYRSLVVPRHPLPAGTARVVAAPIRQAGPGVERGGGPRNGHPGPAGAPLAIEGAQRARGAAGDGLPDGVSPHRDRPLAASSPPPDRAGA